VPFAFKTAAEMLAMARKSGLSIAAMKRANEEIFMDRAALDAGIDGIWSAMDGCIERGLRGSGIMPGGLKVRRRAQALHDKMQTGRPTGPIRWPQMTGCRSMPWR
jgi:L-serine dehydratase